MSQATIKFTPSANASDVSEYSKDVLRNILQESGCDSCVITSTTRTPGSQALAMFKNIEAFGASGQLKLYGPAGDMVIEEYQKKKAEGLGQQPILAAMEAKIKAIGPSNVSLHCADPNELNVIDIAPTSIVKKAAFLAALTNAKGKGLVSRFFSPGDHDPAFHIEIPQPHVA